MVNLPNTLEGYIDVTCPHIKARKSVKLWTATITSGLAVQITKYKETDHVHKKRHALRELQRPVICGHLKDAHQGAVIHGHLKDAH